MSVGCDVTDATEFASWTLQWRLWTLDTALRLFPRYSRALFRRAACLLEAGQAPQAVDAFKALYRVDKD